MKRLITILLVGLFGFAFGCGGGAADAPAPESADDAVAEEGAPADDMLGDEGAMDDEAAPADDMGGEEVGEEEPIE